MHASNFPNAISSIYLMERIHTEMGRLIVVKWYKSGEVQSENSPGSSTDSCGIQYFKVAGT